MKLTLLLACATLAASATAQNLTTAYSAKARAAMDEFLPGTCNLGPIKVTSISADTADSAVTFVYSEPAAYVPFTEARLDTFKTRLRAILPAEYADYKINITDGRRSFDDLRLLAPRGLTTPQDGQFVRRVDAAPAPKGLDGLNLSICQSHGRYYSRDQDRWEWQRCRLHGTVEDLYTQSYVMPFLVPMLENAGAYVLSPRERDVNIHEVIVDGDGHLAYPGYREVNGNEKWQQAPGQGFAYTQETITMTDHPWQEGTSRMTRTVTDASKASKAVYSADIPEDGTYAVYVSYSMQPDAAEDARYTVTSLAGDKHYVVNQKMGGGTWIYLGHFPFKKGKQDVVTLNNLSEDAGLTVSTDAVKIGGGMGNVAREGKKSDYPRFTEAARYWMRWAGAPDTVVASGNDDNDYNNDYKSRGHWLNWLMGGSSLMPDTTGLRIPIDLNLAFHSDAGVTSNDSIIGSLGIYCTVGDTIAGGASRLASRDLTDLVLTQITGDVRETFEPRWTRRGMWDKSYAEARTPQVPALLLELLSHQNLADMKYGLDPAFRFVVSRAIYKGMLRFLAARDSIEPVVQPLPVRAMAINRAGGAYTLSWRPTVDRLEPTAVPTAYRVERRVADGGFQPLAQTPDTVMTLSLNPDVIYSYRVIAINDGGASFPSEVLSVCDVPGTEPVMVVNGFTRVSAPGWYDSGDIAAFDYVSDPGVAYLQDISFTGEVIENRRAEDYRTNDAPGFGASRANYEDRVIAGNTFDYPYIHGEAIRAAGRGFVSSSAEAFATDNTLYKDVDLILGLQKETRRSRGVYGSYFKTFPTALQQRLSAHTAMGGNVFVSGSYIGTDLWDNKDATKADRSWASNVLGYKWSHSRASAEDVIYEVKTPYAAFVPTDTMRYVNDLNVVSYAVPSPDALAPGRKEASVLMRYAENQSVAATCLDDKAKGYRTVAMGVPFEAIRGADQRAVLMRQILDFFKK